MITVTEKRESRESASGESPSATLVYTVRGTADDVQARGALAAEASPTHDGLVRKTWNVEPVHIDTADPGACLWTGTVRYGRTSAPEPETGDVVYAACFGRYGLAGHYPHFDTACFRASRRVYEATPQPWFDFACDATRTRLTLCECRWFLRRLPRGANPKRAGTVGRLTEMVVAPSADGQQRTCNPYEIAASTL